MDVNTIFLERNDGISVSGLVKSFIENHHLMVYTNDFIDGHQCIVLVWSSENKDYRTNLGDYSHEYVVKNVPFLGFVDPKIKPFRPAQISSKPK